MTSYENLLENIRKVRRRRRSQVLVRGVAILLASSTALLVLGIWGADLYGFKPAAVWIVRILTGGLVVFAAWHFLYRPLRVRASDVRVAQYIEEKYPQLEDRLVTAVEVGKSRTRDSGMIRLLIRDAFDKTARVDFSVFLNRGRLAAFGVLGLGALGALAALLAWGPSFIPYGFSNLYAPWTEASLGSARMILVFPGNVEIAKGSDQLIDAQLVGFDSPDVRLYRQAAASGPWNCTVMEPDPRGSAFRYLLVDVEASQRYYVESGGVRSPIYTLEAVDKARVDRIDLTYNFPAYTGMPPQTVEDEGDVSALEGTRLDLAVRLNVPVRSARLRFDDRSALDLDAAGDSHFTGSFVLERSGSYVVEVSEARWGDHPASSEYDIEVVEDAAPGISITRPMRDVRATSVEEIFSEVKAQDDIGVGRVELRYSVNGSAEEAFGLYRGNPPEQAVTASHTFFLEEFGLQPGDLVSYYARAYDGRGEPEAAASSSDIYFIQIRPFQQDYKQSQQQAMQEGSGEGDNGGREALSRQQKEIISATFKLIRDKERMEAKEYRDGLEALALVQGRLQAQTQGMVDRLRRREAAQAGADFQKLEEHLKNAVGEMEKAAADLGSGKPGDALPGEQKSLQQLMRAESLFREIQVSFSSQSAASGGSQASAEDLADLFELELNQLKNQYETVQRAERQERDQKVDEALERLKELAQRQQQLNESNRLRAQQGESQPSSASGGNQSQQQLMEQAEELRRQLQRLSRQRSSPQLSEAGNRIQKAIEEMKRALGDSRNRSGAETAAQGQRALEQMEEALRDLARGREADLEQGLRQAVEESGNLVKQQEKIQQELDRLSLQTTPPDSPEEAIRRPENLVSRKNALAGGLDSLEDRIRDLSRQARKDRKPAADRLADAAEIIRDKRLSERIEEGNGMIRDGYYESQKRREDFIREGLEEVQSELQAAQSSLGESEEGKIEEAADRARQLSEGLESIERRLAEIRSGQGESPDQTQRQGRQQPGSQGKQQEQDQGPGQDRGGQRARGDRGAPEARARDPRDAQNMLGSMPGQDSEVGELSGDARGLPAGIRRYPDQARQLNRELEQRLTDARDLSRLMNRNATLMENLDKVIDALRKSRDYPDYGQEGQAALLRAAIERMREVELDLARNLERLRQLEEYFIAGDNEAPERYRELVEEYYRAIAQGE
ncbi:MAG: hypothetical protein JW793_11225 [Acidobacteria bacterium]|nr:hypothetical protein [Acidobacteriota bacterium]